MSGGNKQLELDYFAQVPDAQQDWEGECFVFDNRIALDTRLQETRQLLKRYSIPLMMRGGWLGPGGYRGMIDMHWAGERR
jgi:hypothetical protein